jgi:hypothetical protein
MINSKDLVEFSILIILPRKKSPYRAFSCRNSLAKPHLAPL